MRKLDLNEQEVIAVYEKYENARQVSKVFGCSTETVYRILKRNGIPRTHRHPKQSKVVRVSNCNTKYCPATIRMLYVVGRCTTSQIATDTGIPIQCVCNTLRRRYNDVYVSRRSRRDASRSVDVDAVEQEYLAGASTYELGEKYGVNHTTISKWMRKRGHCRGKGGGQGNKGAKASAELARRRYVQRFESVSDKVEYLSGGCGSTTVRCKACGREFWWDSPRMWTMDVPCPRCRGVDNESRHLAKLQRECEREQQRIAACEWRLSVPRICRECGDPFYSEYENANYCCDACRRRAANRRATERRMRRGGGTGTYRHRMRIEVNKNTYDRTVTLGAVYKKFKGRCCMCGCKTVRSKEHKPNQATLDHVIALNNNGPHTWDNAQLLCSDCNSKKRDLGQMRLPIAV